MTNKIGDSTRKEYYESVDAIVEEVIDAVKDGELDVDEVYDRIHEQVDGNHWIIYYHAAYAVWMFSDNNEAIDEAVDDGSYSYDQTKNFSQLLTVMAFFAMKADVEQRVAQKIEELED